jgi:hypothetical protein
MADLIVFDIGTKGVNVDTDPISLEDAELRKAQNIIANPLGVKEGITNRPGLIEFNSEAANGSILGGIGVPLLNLRRGTRFIYIGRGPQ